MNPAWRSISAVREPRRKRKPEHRRAEHATPTPESEWWADLEYVWASQVRPEVERLERRARELRAEANELAGYVEARKLGLDGADNIRASGVRVATQTRMSLLPVDAKPETRSLGLRYFVTDRRGKRWKRWKRVRVSVYLAGERRVIVDGDHGSATPEGRRIELLKSAEWCETRAAAASMSRRDLVGTCRGRWRRVGCGCGTFEVEVGCDQTTLCEWCRRRHWKKWRRRIVRAMDAHLRGARGKWASTRTRDVVVGSSTTRSSKGRTERRAREPRGSKPGVYLITLTVPHSGNIVADRKLLGKGWRAVSKAASYGGYDIRDASGNVVRSSAKKWWSDYALVYEATPGTKGDGHLHAHVAVISSWVPYHELRALWERETGSVVVDVVDPATQARRSKARGFKANEAGTAAAYLAKYVTKGVDPAEFTGRKAGELLAAFRNHRKVTTSEGFWRPLAEREKACPGCGECHRLVEAPVGLQDHAPAAVLRALAERTRWRPPRGAPQVLLRW